MFGVVNRQGLIVRVLRTKPQHDHCRSGAYFFKKNMIKEFETSKGRFAFVELVDSCPIINSLYGNEKFKIAIIGTEKTVSIIDFNELCNLAEKYTLKAESLGIAENISEEQWEAVVDFYELSNVRGWYDYTDNLPFPTEKQGLTKNATDSGKSLMESLELGKGNWFLVKFV